MPGIQEALGPAATARYREIGGGVERRPGADTCAVRLGLATPNLSPLLCKWSIAPSWRPWRREERRRWLGVCPPVPRAGTCESEPLVFTPTQQGGSQALTGLVLLQRRPVTCHRRAGAGSPLCGPGTWRRGRAPDPLSASTIQVGWQGLQAPTVRLWGAWAVSSGGGG